MNRSFLIKQIKKRFPSDPLPKMSLRQAVLADCSLTRRITEREWQSERLKDGAIPWTELTDKDLIECRDGLAHLNEESFAYYLGAFLRFAVRHVNAELVSPARDIVRSVIFSVTNRSKYNLQRLKHLNDAQIDCVIAFLHFVEEESQTDAADAAKALARYWLKPEARRKTVTDLV
ncbi:MAG TPA: DUF6714 family protein [Candidatus Baltobacteraceae bacterium]|jgi:hypothetical protein|nr:DUF6714 family protein [Candidatus Baltobacteraceae bacterium]